MRKHFIIFKTQHDEHYTQRQNNNDNNNNNTKKIKFPSFKKQ